MTQDEARTLLAHSSSFEPELVGYDATPSRLYAAFALMKTMLGPAELLEQLADSSVAIRAYLAVHVSTDLPDHLERLYPLLHDHRMLTQVSCDIVWETPLSEFVMKLLTRRAKQTEVCALLLRAVVDPELPPGLRGRALRAVGATSAGLPVAFRFLTTSDPELITGALSPEFIGHLDATELAQVIDRLHQHPAAEVREALADALESRSEPMVRTTLRQMILVDPSEEVRQSAASSFFRREEGSIELATQLLDQADPELRLLAIACLAPEQADRAIPTVEALLRSAGSAGSLALALLLGHAPQDEPRIDGLQRYKRKASSQPQLAVDQYARALCHRSAAELEALSYQTLPLVFSYVARRGLRDCLDEVRRRLVGHPIFTQQAAAATVAALEDQLALPHLELMLLDRNPYARIAAIEAMRRLGVRGLQERVDLAARHLPHWVRVQLEAAVGLRPLAGTEDNEPEESWDDTAAPTCLPR